MKTYTPASILIHFRKTWLPTTLATVFTLYPGKASALPDAFLYFPDLQDGAPIYLSVAALFIAFIVFIVLMIRRIITTTEELHDITGELDATRQRLLETGKQLERTEQNLTQTTSRYEGMLSDSEIGVFQVDLIGKCTFINNALQTMSGLYLKKVDKEGIASGVHPDDRKAFLLAWDEFLKSGKTFDHDFRFLKGRNKVSFVNCRANKVLDANSQVESYIGWVTDLTELNDKTEKIKTESRRLVDFIDETVEGFYRLLPDAPITLSSKPEKNAELLMNKLKLAECSDSFAALYGATAAELIGKNISELKGGCGPFSNHETLQAFIENNYKHINLESTRQGPKGSSMVLVNNVSGIIEERKFIGIWGTQHNITTQKRKQAELNSRIDFLSRILNEIPADVQVKDTRCRFLYASDKLATRTEIPKEEWIGKTIFEVLPATPKDHDIPAIETMKSGKLARIERPFEIRGKSGWMETIQKPLVSEDGLIEGVISMSFDISGKKNKEHEIKQKNRELETQLKQSKTELSQARVEYSKTTTALSEATQRLKVIDTEVAVKENEYKRQISGLKSSEETLARKEQALLGRQQQLEEQMCSRLEELESETNKRRKWEELLSIKEDELRKLEDHTAELKKYYEQETTLRRELEANLEESRADQVKIKKRLEKTDAIHEQELRTLSAKHHTKLESEMNGRTKIEKQLQRTEELLKQTLKKMRHQTDTHVQALEKEIGQRKSATEQLAHRMEELEALRKDFNTRIEEETKSLKQELGLKQIREKALRKESGELEKRLHDLEQTLKTRTQEYSQQMQEKEGVETEKHAIEKKLEFLSKQQESKIELEKDKLNLSIAEIRMNEVKLRKKTGDLQEEKEVLQKNLDDRETELKKLRTEVEKAEKALAESKAEQRKLEQNQDALMAEKTRTLNDQIAELQQSQQILEEKAKGLEFDKQALETSLEKEKTELADAAREYRKVVDAFNTAQEKLKEMKNDQKATILSHTNNLNIQLEKLCSSEQTLKKQEAKLQERVTRQQEEVNNLKESLRIETGKRNNAETAVAELEKTLTDNQAGADAQIRQQTASLTRQVENLKSSEEELSRKLKSSSSQIDERDRELAELKKEREETTAQLYKLEQKLSSIKKEHQTEIREAVSQVKDACEQNENLVEELSSAVKNSLAPVIKSTQVMEKADNLMMEQKTELHHLNHSCVRLIDMLDFRKELTLLAEHTEEVKEDEFDLHGLLSDIDNRYSHRADTKKLFFAVSFAQYQASNNVPKMVITDGEKVSRILSILLGYALEQTDKGRVGLHASRKSDADGKVMIDFELAFTGKEPKDKLLTSVFEENSSVVDLEHGLTLVQRYTELLGGRIELENRKEGITALMLEFPFGKVLSSDSDDNENRDSEQAGAA